MRDGNTIHREIALNSSRYTRIVTVICCIARFVDYCDTCEYPRLLPTIARDANRCSLSLSIFPSREEFASMPKVENCTTDHFERSRTSTRDRTSSAHNSDIVKSSRWTRRTRMKKREPEEEHCTAPVFVCLWTQLERWPIHAASSQ